MSDGGTWPSIPAMLDAAAQRFGGKLAIEDGHSRFTFAELLEEARSFGAALVAVGVEPGDRVAIWTCNSVEWVVAMLGSSLAGGVLVPVNTRFKGGEAADILTRSRARVLVTATDFLGTDYVEMLRSTGAELPDLATIVVARGRAPDDAESWAGFLRTGHGGRTGRSRSATGARRAGRSVGHPLHLGHHRPAQGGGHDPRPHPVCGHRLGGDDGAVSR